MSISHHLPSIQIGVNFLSDSKSSCKKSSNLAFLKEVASWKMPLCSSKSSYVSLNRFEPVFDNLINPKNSPMFSSALQEKIFF